MSGQDYIKFLTQEITSYLDKLYPLKNKKNIQDHHLLYSNQWFGVLPFFLKSLIKNK